MKVITENTIKRIVREALENMLLLEFDVKQGMGESGPLTEDNLLKPVDFMKTTYALYRKCMRVPKEKRDKLNIDKIFANDPGYIIWKNYVVNMLGSFEVEDGELDSDGDVIKKPILQGFKPDDREHKFPKFARDFFGWLSTLKRGAAGCPFLCFKSGNNYIYGHWNHNYFIASYISTDGKRGLIPLMSEISKYSNVIFAVTLDIGNMLERIGFLTDGKIYHIPFAGNLVEKKIYATNPMTLYIAQMIEGQNEANRNKQPKRRGRPKKNS